jgi:phosphopantothenoylcysteine synthetase/decarboxylase
VGFALEPAEELLASAKAKLTRKRADCIVANPLETMDSESVQGCLVWPDGHADQPDGGATVSKRAFANWLANIVLPAATARCRQG